MKRSKFSLSNYKLLTGNAGYLMPCGLLEVLPGDSIQQSTNMLIRVSPLLAPVMHPVHARVHHWFVPHRLIWEDWEIFITGGPDGMDASTFPTITIGGGGAAVGSLADYLGVPTGVNNLVVSALPFRGCAMIYNEWYRDQDVITPLVIDKTSGADTTTNVTLQKVAWEKDYFTSARDEPQKGPDITIPLGTVAPLTLKTAPTPAALGRVASTGAAAGAVSPLVLDASGELNTGTTDLILDLTGSHQANLSGASAITVTALREAMGLQRYEEARSRFGSRYTEYLRYLGVRSSDARLQRPEYLGGGKQTIQFSEVLQTADNVVEDEVIDSVGTLRGHGIGALRSARYRRYFEEHGYIISFVSIKPRTMYVQGLPRTWNRRFKEDFWQTELQHIGQQEVLYKEVYAAHATPEGTFGYQDRYDEYRRQESTIAGEFRTTDANFWHYARIFSGDPALNAAFINCDPTDRVYAVPSKDQFYIMANHSIQARRIIASTGTSFIY